MSDPRPIESMRVTFWPRSSPDPSELDVERLCEKCGYNLRGLKENRCPECGTEFHRRQHASSQLPWKQREAIGGWDGYWRTVGLILFRPRRLSEEVWYGGRITERDTRLFRFVTIALAFVPLMVLVLSLIGPHLSREQFTVYAIGTGVLGLVWLVRSTRLPVKFFHKLTMRGDVQARAVALAHLTCAPLSMSFIHIALLAGAGVAARVDGTDGVLFPVACLTWGVFAVLQLLAWLRAVLTLVHATTKVNEAEVLGLAGMLAVAWIAHAGTYLLVIPFALHLFVTKGLGLF